MTHLQTVVSDLAEVADGYFEMSFEWPEFLNAPEPGQFFTIRAGRTTAPLLRRPFAFSGMDDRGAVFIFERRGPATDILAGKRPGDRLDVLGPLGNSFPFPKNGWRPILVAGGIGVGPIMYFCRTLAATGSNPLLLLGGRTSAKIPKVSGIPGSELVICTEDGTAGFGGTPIDYLREKYAEVARGQSPSPSVELYVCGPHGLLAAGHELAERWGARAWVSMEQTMGCAVGACMGCAVRVHSPAEYARVCTEGPVFDSRLIVWN